MTISTHSKMSLRRDNATPASYCTSGSEELLAGSQLLRYHAGDADHRQAAVVELLGLHLLQRSCPFWLEAQRIETQVARSVLVADLPWAEVHVVVALLPLD